MIYRHPHPQTHRRMTSPLTFLDTNVPRPPHHLHTKSPPPSQPLRMKRAFTQTQNSSAQAVINMSFKQNMEPQSRPRFSFSVRTNQPSIKAPSVKFNLMASCNLRSQNVIQKNPTIRPFSLAAPEIEQPKLSQEMSVDDFSRLKELGRGKFGTVWLSIHKTTNFLCALKIIKKQVVREQKVEHQIARQIRIHNQLRHKNIIGFYGFFTDKENFYIVSEYATEGPLFGLLKKHHRLEEEEVKDYTRQTAQGIQAIHRQGFIHRDIKPQNLLLQFGVVKVCDLGWAVEHQMQSMRQSQCGTPLYYSPEMVRKEGHNEKIDIWSLGLLVYELMVGRVPFKIWSEFDLPVILEQEVDIPYYIDASQNLKDFVMKCLEKDQKLRQPLQSLKKHEFIKSEVNDDVDAPQFFSQLLTILL